MAIRTQHVRTWLEPKRGGGTRRMAELTPKDAKAWASVAARLAEPIEARLGDGVLGNRATRTAHGWRLEALGPALTGAAVAARSLARRRSLVVRTDVREFYPSITPSVLYRSLAPLDDRAACVAATMLEGWGSEGYPGLPIGPPGSAVLANAVLMDVDRALEPYPHLRWVDDYLIGLPCEGDVDDMLDHLDHALSRQGLARAPEKTSLQDGALGWLGGSGVA